MRPESDTKQKLLETTLDLIWESSYGSVSVEDICRRAGVQKGSFYHFFPSKSELGAAALEEYWVQYRRPQLDQIFSVQHPPLQRFLTYCDKTYENQKNRLEKWGKVVGCPITSIGSELSTQDEKVRLKSQEIGGRICRYLEAALRDAERDGLLKARDLPALAREFYAFVTGVLLQARIRNDLELVKTIKPGMLRMLGLEARARV
jgi:TetR/AcrR family transcriptional repressor of nem operon